jgi:hypothetical protein
MLVYGSIPFEAKDYESTLKLNEKCDIVFDIDKMICKCSQSGLDLMKKMLEKDPNNRAIA